ncbi:MAG: LLM class flavin-dependent oxidoreductase [Microcella sp.]|uniref:LLM class flavin-dependent oxidoreductase n=1 Tax=Microcella sp. TaxID=1913979 RepID=UPI0024C54B2F|nr:LLM class flavin-dependent oxidoreductase [Microcella sp.]UYN84596.1 MAG: LLM class flavin-dependent oxidoreductase [Microcella sp.]
MPIADPNDLELGLDTFGDVTSDDRGEPLGYAEVIRNVVAEGVLADQVGVDAITVGEHHRDDFAVSAPDVVLTAIAARTERIRIGSGVTVLSSDDPIRVFQRFATLDAISHGRAEIIMGRGSFTESFPLFGYALNDYQTLFEEKLNLFAAVREEKPVTWQGTTRAPLADQMVYPTTESGALRTWVGVGGSPESVVRAANYGFPLMLAVIGGQPERFAPFVELYHRALTQLEKPWQPVGVHSPGYIADTDEQAMEELWPAYEIMFGRIGRERGWGPTTYDHFRSEVEHGSLYVGSPETVARKIASTVSALGIQRFDLKYSTGPLAHGKLLHAIELYGTRVIPMVRELLADRLVGASS